MFLDSDGKEHQLVSKTRIEHEVLTKDVSEEVWLTSPWLCCDGFINAFIGLPHLIRYFMIVHDKVRFPHMNVERGT